MTLPLGLNLTEPVLVKVDNGPPERQSWGGTLMHVKDPGGNIVSFVQNQST